MTTVYIVDDDDAIRDALAWLFSSRDIPVRTWPGAEAFLADWQPDQPGCLILDIRMQGMSGIELQEALRTRGCSLPIIFLTGHGDVPLAVTALKKGAYDFLEKPFDDNLLVERALEALEIDRQARLRQASDAGTETRLASLSGREREVMEMVLAGKLNKQIADELGIAMRTVEVHRARVFEKMGVRSAVELAQLLSRKP